MGTWRVCALWSEPPLRAGEPRSGPVGPTRDVGTRRWWGTGRPFNHLFVGGATAPLVTPALAVRPALRAPSFGSPRGPGPVRPPGSPVACHVRTGEGPKDALGEVGRVGEGGGRREGSGRNFGVPWVLCRTRSGAWSPKLWWGVVGADGGDPWGGLGPRGVSGPGLRTDRGSLERRGRGTPLRSLARRGGTGHGDGGAAATGPGRRGRGQRLASDRGRWRW